MALTAQQKKAMAAGRARKRKTDERAAVARVLAYTRWLKAGSKFDGSMPTLPNNADYKIARRLEKIK